MPKKKQPNNQKTVDATGKPLGRLASEIAILLRGKDRADFVYHQDKGISVIVENADKIKITGKKLDQKEYVKYSGYPGGLKKTKARDISSSAMLRKAVFGMLPKNKLRSKMIKRLIIK